MTEVTAAAEKEAAKETEAPKPENIESRGAGSRRQAVERVIANENADKEEKDGGITKEDAADATAWFLSDDEADEVAVQVLEIDVGRQQEKLIRWVVQAVDRDRIAEIRKESREIVARRSRNRQFDPMDDSAEMIANVRIATEGTLEPNLRNLRGSMADPADALKKRFGFKPGLIDQIAAAVIRVSGYDTSDVREVDAVKS